jgi:hypothetical protein
MSIIRAARACAGIAILAITAAATAADLHVPSAYPTIQAAIDDAKAGDTVIVADGVYTGDGNRDLSFLGKAITVRSAGGAAACTIDCQGTQEDPHRGFSFTSGETPASVVQGFTIRGGSTPQGAIADQFNGAAILCAGSSSPTIRDCTLTGSWAGCWGGALCASSNSHPTIDRCTITGNHSDDDGGGLFAWNGSTLTIVDSMIVGNTSRITGGAITNFGGLVTVENSTIAGNDGPVGAAIYGWNMVITNTIIWGNTGDDVQIQGSPEVTYSNVQGGFPGVGNMDVDPGFVDAAAGDFTLGHGSAMIDQGDPAFVADAGATDIEGDPRVVGTRVDIGADEVLRAGDVDRDGVVGFVDLLAVLAAWGPCPSCPEDTNDDGLVDFLDLLAVLSTWGG